MLQTVRNEENNNLKVSIIIPCRNEEKYIGQCLNSLLANDYCKKYSEIIIVDGMSSDRTPAIIKKYTQHYNFIRVIDNPHLIIPIALNLGIRAAKFDIIIRIDAHADYASNYISKLVEGLHKYKADNIGGVIDTYYDNSTLSKAIGIIFSHPFTAGNAYYRVGSNKVRKVNTVFCGCYRRDVFKQIGYFNEKLIRTQDREFNARLIKNGGKIILDPSIKCTYFPKTNIKDYYKRNYLGAFWLYYARRFTKTKMLSIINFVPLLFVGWHLIGFILLIFFPELTPFLLIPIIIYLGLVTFFSIKAAFKQKCLQIAPIMIILFGITHYGYGIGGIIGLLKAILLGRDI